MVQTYFVGAGVYGGNAANEEGLVVALLAMRAQLFAWYRQRRGSHRGESLTQLTDLTPSMVGTHTSKKCKTKAAETWSLLLFLLSELRRFGTRLGSDWRRFLLAGEALEGLVLVWRTSTWVLPASVIEDTINVAVPGPPGA